MKAAVIAALLWLTAVAPALAQAFPQGFYPYDTPRDMPEVRFVTGDGTTKTLQDFRGKVILLNIWATWCIPCRKEMPTLDALQADLGSSKFEVVTLSIDKGGVAVVRRFYDEIGIKQLNMYVDETMLSYTNLRIIGLPTTMIVDADGRELARLIGPAVWNAPDMEAFLKTYIK